MPSISSAKQVRPHAGARPMALLALALGVAIGGSLAGAPVKAVDTSALAPLFERPAGSRGALLPKPVRVIPLPVRAEPVAPVR